MAWTTALSDLRNLLSDNVTDRYCYRKKVFGQINGVNLSFKTFEFRRVTNFTSAVTPLGVYISGVRVLDTNVTIDDVASGEFTLAASVVPVDGQIVQATYYTQQFLDSELTSFLTNACQSFLQLGSDFTQIDPALIEAALHYAAGNGLKKLSMRWSQRASDAFLLEDVPKKEAIGLADTISKLGMDYIKLATSLRDSAYTNRGGQSLGVNFVSNWGAVRAGTPRR